MSEPSTRIRNSRLTVVARRVESQHVQLQSVLDLYSSTRKWPQETRNRYIGIYIFSPNRYDHRSVRITHREATRDSSGPPK